jgi:hypothetical protein
MAADDDIPLSLVPQELREQKLTRRPVKYRQIYNAAVDGRIPAVRGDNGRWTVARRRLPEVAEALDSTAAVA